MTAGLLRSCLAMKAPGFHEREDYVSRKASSLKFDSSSNILGLFMRIHLN